MQKNWYFLIFAIIITGLNIGNDFMMTVVKRDEVLKRLILPNSMAAMAFIPVLMIAIIIIKDKTLAIMPINKKDIIKSIYLITVIYFILVVIISTSITCMYGDVGDLSIYKISIYTLNKMFLSLSIWLFVIPSTIYVELKRGFLRFIIYGVLLIGGNATLYFISQYGFYAIKDYLIYISCIILSMIFYISYRVSLKIYTRESMV